MIIAANFKTNHTRKSTKEFIKELDYFLRLHDIDDTVVIFPPNTAYDNFDTDIKLGAQNAYHVEKGSFTGEIGLEQLNEFGIKTILIGHSERRHILGETQELISKKFKFFSKNGFEIIYCIGEPKEIREQGIEAVMEYLWKQFDNIDINYNRLIVAYEPVWAIGTGLTATATQIDETLNLLRDRIKAPLLYGGSVKVANIKEILSIRNCNGVLVGTASWEIKSFCDMISISKTL